MKIAVVGATGLVGTKMLEILEERNFPVTELIPVASSKSVGKVIGFKGKQFVVTSPEEALNQRPHIALFSAGASTSKEWAPRFAESGTTVIDNSSAWRMDKNIPLVVPEVNASVLTKENKIIANPNCSTIQMVVALSPIYIRYGIKRLVISTYQSVTGTGAKAVAQLMSERNSQHVTEKAYPYPIDLNVIPQIDVFVEDGYTKEEMKMINETRKILGDEKIAITATTVRIPVTGGHSESVNVETFMPFEIDDIRSLYNNTPGTILKDNPKELSYPMPIDAHNNDIVWVGRIRRDFSQPNSFNIWIVSDNLRKGAATNAVQIAEYLINQRIV
ncbi:MAG: aspartate-semialdehyde dehydrogenase [Bacteroidetes bacterium]|nr:aspartate-semialdehyde dehydrogenase [Bacteroidota bacterium]